MSEMKTLKFPGDTEPREIVDAKAREDITKLSEDIADSGYKADIERAASLGIAAGYEDGTFRPDENCTRGQMCAFAQALQHYQGGITDGMANTKN